MLKKFVLSALFLLAFVSLASAYTDHSFSVSVKVDEDGNAHVVEKSTFTLDNDREQKAFDYSMSLGKTTLADWQKYSRNIHYHFSGSIDVTSLKIIATREYALGFQVASVYLEYDAPSLFVLEEITTRVTRYSLDPDRLAFSPEGKAGEISLSSGMYFSVELPSDALNVRVVPNAGVNKEGHNILRWNGPISSKWEVSFEREKALSAEVNEFFVDLYETLTPAGWLTIFLVCLLAIIVAKYLKLSK